MAIFINIQENAIYYKVLLRRQPSFQYFYKITIYHHKRTRNLTGKFRILSNILRFNMLYAIISR